MVIGIIFSRENYVKFERCYLPTVDQIEKVMNKMSEQKQINYYFFILFNVKKYKKKSHREKQIKKKKNK